MDKPKRRQRLHFDLHQSAATPARPRNRAAISRPCRASRKGGRAQGA
jgi:hypothetical protein